MRMNVRSKLTLNIIYLVIGVHAVLAWLPPERCDQRKKTEDFPADGEFSFTKSVPTVGNITEIASNQNQMLHERYPSDTFFSVPISGYFRGCDHCEYEMYAPNSCKFHTYNPRLLSSVYCQNGVACKLSHTVSTVETYAAAEGYNWGAKVSTKVSFLSKMFEVGGEASTGGSYSCTYTKSKTITDNVECSVADGKGRTLQLFNVQSDLKCQFSTITMEEESRNGKLFDQSEYGYFAEHERHQVHDFPIFRAFNDRALPNLDRVPSELVDKMKGVFPEYNPYTDIVYLYSYARSHFYKKKKTAPGRERIIPFSNENGDSVYQYACILT